MSLINNSIEAMGDPNATKATGAAQKTTSIGFWHSVSDWWKTSSALQKPTDSNYSQEAYAAARAKNLQIEYDLFRAILSPSFYIVPPGEAEASGKIVGRFIDTQLPKAGKGVFLHEFEISNTTDTSLPKREVVVIHGYMAAMGYFVKNFEALAMSYGNLVVHVLDMPGFGNSGRPKFPKALTKLPSGATRADEIEQVINVENWFIDKFEEWRIARNIKHFDLVAHSMGAYLSSCYLMKYNKSGNERVVSRLVLISPMGTEASDVSYINDKTLQFNHHEAGSNPLREIFANQDFQHHDGVNEELYALWEKLGKPKFPRNVLLRKLWENSVSPFQLLQVFGPFYSKVLSFWSFQRFQNLQSNDDSGEGSNEDLILKLHEYSFSIFNQYQGSGELAITKLINHEILPRLPLCDRGFLEFLHESGIKSLWMYGDKDWMNRKGGEYCVERLGQLGSEDSTYELIEDAGHHIYLDNPEHFNKLLISFLEL